MSSRPTCNDCGEYMHLSGCLGNCQESRARKEKESKSQSADAVVHDVFAVKPQEG